VHSAHPRDGGRQFQGSSPLSAASATSFRNAQRRTLVVEAERRRLQVGFIRVH
jgi:hypothetical protein